MLKEEAGLRSRCVQKKAGSLEATQLGGRIGLPVFSRARIACTVHHRRTVSLSHLRAILHLTDNHG